MTDDSNPSYREVDKEINSYLRTMLVNEYRYSHIDATCLLGHIEESAFATELFNTIDINSNGHKVPSTLLNDCVETYIKRMPRIQERKKHPKEFLKILIAVNEMEMFTETKLKLLNLEWSS